MKSRLLHSQNLQDISLKAYFNCLKAFDICQESIWTVQTVSEQCLSLLEMFPIFSHCKNFWIALLPRYHGLELSHLYILFFPFTLDVINFLNSCQVKKMTKNTLEMMMMQVTILFFFNFNLKVGLMMLMLILTKSAQHSQGRWCSAHSGRLLDPIKKIN